MKRLISSRRSSSSWPRRSRPSSPSSRSRRQRRWMERQDPAGQCRPCRPGPQGIAASWRMGGHQAARRRGVEDVGRLPGAKEKSGVVLVIHDIRGMADWPRALGDQLAQDGFIAIVPDFLSGKGPNGGGTESLGTQVGQTIQKLTADEVNARLNAAMEYGKKLPASNGKTGVVGFCWGGAAASATPPRSRRSMPRSSTTAKRRSRTRPRPSTPKSRKSRRR